MSSIKVSCRSDIKLRTIVALKEKPLLSFDLVSDSPIRIIVFLF